MKKRSHLQKRGALFSNGVIFRTIAEPVIETFMVAVKGLRFARKPQSTLFKFLLPVQQSGGRGESLAMYGGFLFCLEELQDEDEYDQADTDDIGIKTRIYHENPAGNGCDAFIPGHVGDEPATHT